MKHHLVLAGSLALAFPLGAAAATVRGLVCDEQGEPLGFTNVVVHLAGPDTTYGAIADRNGQWAVDVRPGAATLEYRYVGRLGATIMVDVGVTDTTVATVQLVLDPDFRGWSEPYKPSFSGIVRDVLTDAPLEGVTVFVWESRSSACSEKGERHAGKTVSDVTGTYTFRDPSCGGPFELLFWKEGFETIVVTSTGLETEGSPFEFENVYLTREPSN